MNNYFETPICPNCGADIVENGTIDECYDVDSINFVVWGTCPDCGKVYRWVDHYEYAYGRDLEEEEKD